MIDLKISFQLSSDGNDLNVQDQTVWPSDGFERSAMNLFLFSTRGLDVDVLDETLVPSGNSKTVGSWSLEDAKDGVYRTVFIAAPDFAPADAYTKNSLVALEEELYYASKDITAGTSITAENCWYKVTKLDQILALTSFPNSHYLVSNYFKDEQTNICIGEKAIAYARKTCGCADTCSQIEDYHWTTVYHSAATYSFGWGQYKQAGELLGMALKRCGTADQSEPCNCH